MNKTNNPQTRKDTNEQEHKNKETWKTLARKNTQTKSGTNEQENKNKERCQQTKEQDQKPTQKHNAQKHQNMINKLFFIITNFGGKSLFIIWKACIIWWHLTDHKLNLKFYLTLKWLLNIPKY